MIYCKDIDRGQGEIIRVEISEFKKEKRLNIRTWYTDKQSGEYKPTQRGVALRPELFEELKSAILEAEPHIKLILNENQRKSSSLDPSS